MSTLYYDGIDLPPLFSDGDDDGDGDENLETTLFVLSLKPATPDKKIVFDNFWSRFGITPPKYVADIAVGESITADASTTQGYHQKIFSIDTTHRVSYDIYGEAIYGELVQRRSGNKHYLLNKELSTWSPIEVAVENYQQVIDEKDHAKVIARINEDRIAQRHLFSSRSKQTIPQRTGDFDALEDMLDPLLNISPDSSAALIYLADTYSYLVETLGITKENEPVERLSHTELCKVYGIPLPKKQPKLLLDQQYRFRNRW